MKRCLLSTCALCCTFFISPVTTASFVFNTSGVTSSIPTNNNFASNIMASGYDSMLIGESLSVNSSGTLTFRFVGSESGYTNSFVLNGQTIFQEQKRNYAFNSNGYDTGLGRSFEIFVNAGETIDFAFDSLSGSALAPVENLSGKNLEGLAIFYDSSSSMYTNIILGYDDQLFISDDDNHDDLMISASFTPVPLPMSALLFTSGLGALLFSRRRALIAQRG